MLIYILKFSACLAIFMVFYKLFLEKSSIHNFKRFYLLGALVLAVVIPSLTFVEYIEPIVFENLKIVEPMTSIEIGDTILQGTLIQYTPIILWSIYALGVFVFLLKFFLNLYRMISRIRNSPKYKSASFINVLVKNLMIPHTFFSYIFLNKYKFENAEIPEEVILHEQTHAKQKHSIDILILEILQILFWFNPLIYFLKRDVKLNHEFLADRAVLQNGIQPSVYQQLLLSFSSSASEPQLANAINYSSIKKRFTVMKTKTSKTSIWLRSLLVLPLLALLLFSFTDRKQVIKSEITETNTSDEFIPNNVYAGSSGIIERQQTATPKQLAEYNKLAKQYNKQPLKQRIIKLKDIKRLEGLYKLMSDEQKKNAQPFPECPPPPPSPVSIEVIEIEEVPSPSPVSIEVREIKDVPPPPPLPKNATLEQKKKYKRAIKNYKTKKLAKVTKLKNKKGELVEIVEIPEVIEVLSQAPLPKNATLKQKKKYKLDVENYKAKKLTKATKQKKEKGKLIQIVEIPPPPPRKSSLDFAIDLAKKNAKFYYENEEISSDKAIALLKKNPKLNLLAKNATKKQPLVYISKAPIVLKKKE
ncbi:MAG: M56 family metallopeptidase [Psychroserpens sp.]|uniref:M56 family metallopeptidase n=1 Tax=Psychroserpens sp. TaxID=2020870 RepID=UPI003002C3FB